MADFSLPLRLSLPERQPAAEPAGTPAQQAFRQTIRAVEALREQLHTLRAAQVATRQAYWRQVGPLAAATVAARRALYAPLEEALLGGYLSRAEEQQVTELLLHNAQSLQERFGEDESAVLTRYAPAPTPPKPTAVGQPAAPRLPHHEQAAACARERRQRRAQAAREAKAQQADTAGQALLQNTKAAYRQLARLHHPDRAALADAATQQAQTELMQRITVAYAAGDLAALLALLAEAPAGEAPTPEADDLLRRYTQALAQQQAQLSQQLTTAQRPVADAPWSGTEKQQRTRLREIKRSLRAETDYLGYLLRQLHEPVLLKDLLRELSSRGQNSL
ncbi:MAG TPA: J domain-containing protein [Hymenobacter sp.]|uniref:J domain-containing protein n=1 Tax=Hymenobacter sp. TaxID=1898978 RepID=UPI002D7E7B2A|nr:J domain-containing protein [Hymenobacter sp.]HET9505260.1 J domain-containing protein [Hymenobacter sp.]